jgi:alpha-ketoglutarate-dependent taurine dioxygenase
MKIENIYDAWGSIVILDSPQEFFTCKADFWRKMMYERKLVIFKKVKFTKAEYAEFSTYFGHPWASEDYTYSREVIELVDTKHGSMPISPFSNANTKMIDDREMPWHADIPNRAHNPFPFRSLWITENPNPEISGKTSWLNLEKAIQFLTPEMTDMLSKITIVQQSWYEEGHDIQEFNMIKVHPITKVPSLRLNYYNWGSLSNAWIKDVKINGVSQKHCFLIRQWLQHLEKIEELKYQHTWDLYDIAVYDNWPFLHSRTALKFNVDNPIRHFYRINIDHLDEQAWNLHKQKYELANNS